MDRGPSIGHENDVTTPAPGELELVRSFLALHDHVPGDPASLPPSPTTIERWLRAAPLFAKTAPIDAEDLRWAAGIRDDLRTLVGMEPGSRRGRAAARRLDGAAQDAGVGPRFGTPDLAPTAPGVRGAIGRLLAVAFLARLDGSWERLRRCSNPTCLSVFYDGSKNHSGRWCSMSACGNQAKVRAFRERQKAGSR